MQLISNDEFADYHQGVGAEFDCGSACGAAAGGRGSSGDGGGPPGGPLTDRSSRASFYRAHTPRSSCFFYSESQPSVITAGGGSTAAGFPPGAPTGHKQSFSTREVREQHLQIQKLYRPQRRRHITDPVDFEGKFLGCLRRLLTLYVVYSSSTG